jgi:hypothetical protein
VLLKNICSIIPILIMTAGREIDTTDNASVVSVVIGGGSDAKGTASSNVRGKSVKGCTQVSIRLIPQCMDRNREGYHPRSPGFEEHVAVPPFSWSYRRSSHSSTPGGGTLKSPVFAAPLTSLT